MPQEQDILLEEPQTSRQQQTAILPQGDAKDQAMDHLEAEDDHLGHTMDSEEESVGSLEAEIPCR